MSYDLIIGREFVSHVGTAMSFEIDSVQWINQSISMKDHIIIMICVHEQYEDEEALSEA